MNSRAARWVLAIALILAAAVGATLAGRPRSVTTAPRPMAGSHSGLAAVPLDARAAVGATLGRAEPAYWFHGLRAANPAQRLQVGFSARGVHVDSGGGALGLSLVAFGRSGAESRVAPVAPSFGANRVLYDRGIVREWYTNSPLGLEQGFDVAKAPAGTSGTLVFSMDVSGNLRPSVSGGTVRFTGAGASLSYGGLIAVDGTGRQLPASITWRGGRLILSVDARGARYPLRVDPTIAQFTQTALLGTGPVSGYDNDIQSVAISGSTLVVGAPGAYVNPQATTSAKGAVFVYQEPAGGWGSTSSPTATLTASDGAYGDEFGTSVAISSDGGTIVASAPYRYPFPKDSNQGAAYVFTGGGSSWTQKAELTLPSPNIGSGPIGTNGSLATSGSTVVVGTNNDALAGSGLYVYQEPVTGWADTSTPTTELVPPVSFVSGALGANGVAMSSDGNTIVAGDTSKGDGAAYVYVKSGSWKPGEAPTAVLTASNPTSTDNLGDSVAISGDGNTIVAGDPGTNGNTGNGSVFLYERPGNTWASETQNAELTVPATNTGTTDEAGSSVAISGGVVVAGAPFAPGGPTQNNNGAVFLFSEPGSGWADSSAPNAELVTSGTDAGNDRLGQSVAITGTTVFGSAPQAYLHGAPATYVWTGPYTDHTLTVDKAGTGSGRVVSTPAGIACGGTCSGGFQTGAQVMLTETPATGSTFAGWSGGGCSGTVTMCTVTMSSDQTVTATFKTGSGPPPPPPAPSCTIHPKSDDVLVKGKPRSKIGALTVTATCTEAAAVTVRAKVTAQHGKGKAHTFSLGAAHGNASANAPLTLTEKLPASAVKDLKKGYKESVLLTLNASNANGRASATATIPRLHGT
jgi:hypothetical protein